MALSPPATDTSEPSGRPWLVVSFGKAAKMLGMSIDGLRKWEREGRLVPVRTVTDHRRYRVADLCPDARGCVGCC